MMLTEECVSICSTTRSKDRLQLQLEVLTPAWYFLRVRVLSIRESSRRVGPILEYVNASEIKIYFAMAESWCKMSGTPSATPQHINGKHSFLRVRRCTGIHIVAVLGLLIMQAVCVPLANDKDNSGVSAL